MGIPNLIFNLAQMKACANFMDLVLNGKWAVIHRAQLLATRKIQGG